MEIITKQAYEQAKREKEAEEQLWFEEHVLPKVKDIFAERGYDLEHNRIKFGHYSFFTIVEQKPLTFLSFDKTIAYIRYNRLEWENNETKELIQSVEFRV